VLFIINRTNQAKFSFNRKQCLVYIQNVTSLLTYRFSLSYCLNHDLLDFRIKRIKKHCLNFDLLDSDDFMQYSESRPSNPSYKNHSSDIISRRTPRIWYVKARGIFGKVTPIHYWI